MNFLERIKEINNKENTRIYNKMHTANEFLTDEERNIYKLNDEDKAIADIFARHLNGEDIPGFRIADFLASPQAKVLVPKIIEGTARRAADPLYVASKLFKKIRLASGASIQSPAFGVVRAFDVAEGGEIPSVSIDWNLRSNEQIKVGKTGVRIQYSDEVKADCTFDIISIYIAEAGRAMARLKEQKAFHEFKTHGNVIFDNNLYKANPKLYKHATTNGVDFEGNLNGTMSLEDYLDLVFAVHANEYTPTNTIMHPLAFPAFIKNGLTGALTAVNEKDAKYDSIKTFKFGPEAVTGKLPFGLQVDLTPFATINKEKRTFDMIVADRNNVGYLVVRDELKTDSFRDPSRDLNNVKFIERYGFGVADRGRAICVAKNISMSKSYPTPTRVIVQKAQAEKK